MSKAKPFYVYDLLSFCSVSARSVSTLFLAFAALLTAAAPAQAQTEVPSNWPLIPSGLSAGDQFRLLVVVEEARDATATDIAEYDSFVQTEISQNGHASIRDHSSIFKVLGSTATVDARDHTNTTYTASDTGVPIYWLNGSKIADDYDDFYDDDWDGNSKANPRYEDGSAVNPANSFRIWTGSFNDGTTFTNQGGQPLGGNGDGTGKTRTARPTGGTGTLNNGQRDVATEVLPVFALSGVFEVGTSSAATVSNIQITSTNGGDGEYVAGDELEFTVTFSEAVTVTGSPQLNFVTNDTGGSSPETRQATYDSGASTGTELVFNYTITSGDFDEDGIELPRDPIDLNGGTIVSQASSDNADLAFAGRSDQAAHKIHIKPKLVLSSVSVVSDPASAANGYVTGETIRIAVTWDKMVRAVTNPVGTSSDPNYLPGGASQVTIKFDSDDGLAAYSEASDDYTLHFDYVVQPDDWDDGGLVTNSYLVRNGGAITRKEVTDGVARFVRAAETGLALPQQIAHKVNVNRPKFSSLAVTSSPATGDTYQTGETIKAELTFDQTVTVDETGGTPRVTIELQSEGVGAPVEHYFDYASGSGTATLVFEYVVQAGDSDDNGITIPAKALKLNGGTIRSANGTDLHLEGGVPDGGTDYSGHKVDGGTVVAVTVSFDAATYTASEEGADATVTVNLSADPERDVVIPIVAEGANGGSANDFTLTSQTVTIASGATSGTFKVRATDDLIDDDGETVALSFGGLPTGVTAGAQATASVSITDEDTRGVIYSSQSVRVPEGLITTADVFTMKLATQPSNDVRVTFAEDPDQQLDITPSLNFTPSNWGTPQPVSVVWAANASPDENIVITLTPEFQGSDYRDLVTPATVTLTIFDRSRPRLESATVDGTSLVLTYNQDLDDTSVPAQGDFEVTVDGADVSVSSVSIGSSVSIDGAKVTLTLATAAVMGDEVEVSYTVPTTNPIQDEDENKAGALTDRAVTNNSPDTTAPSFSSATINGDMLVLTYDEDLDTGSTPASGAFEVTVDGADVSVSSVSIGSSVSIDGAKVTLTLATAAVMGDAVVVSYTVPANNPIQDEAENMAAAFSNESVTNNTGEDSDATLSALTLTETDGTAISLNQTFASGTTSYTAMVAVGIEQVTIVGTPTSSAASVAYTPSTDADPNEDDHQVDLSFGENTLKIVVTAADATEETYTVTVEREKPVVEIMGIQVAEGDASASLGVSLTPAVNEEVVVNYETRDYPDTGSPDHAYAGYDYTAVSGSLTFAANETAKTIEVEILEDDLYEGGGEVDGETFWVYLALPAGAKNANVGVPGAVLIRDNDDPPTVSIADASAAEGDPVSFTVSLSEVSGLDVTASYTTSVKSDDTAISDTDFTAVTGGTVTVAAGSTTATADVVTVEDTHYEADETFTVTLSAPPAGTHLNATLSSDPVVTGTITNDDVLEQVTGVTPTVGNAKLTINWTAVVGAGGYKVQWKSGTEDYSDSATPSRQATISSGTTTSYELTGLTNDVEYTIRVAATHSAADDGAWSSEVSATPRTPNSPAGGEPTISGEALVGEELTADASGITDANGTTTATYAYQWIRVDSDGVSNATDIANATGSTYTLIADDENKKIKVKVNFTDDAEYEEERTSAAYPATSTVGPARSDDATLSALTLAETDGTAISLNQTFSPGTTSYTAEVADDVAQVTIAATANHSAASVAYTPSTDADTEEDGHQVDLSFGQNTLTVVVTAQDESTETYTVTVTRKKSDDATLSALTLAETDGTAISLNQTFSSNRTSYTAEVEADVPRITIAATANHSAASVAYTPSTDDDTEVDGHQVDLSFGQNTLTVVVTAQDENTETYTVRVMRKPVTVGLATTGHQTTEDNTSLEFTVTLSPAVDEAVTVDYQTVSNPPEDYPDAPVAGEDYVAASGSLTFAANETSKIIEVRILEDLADEEDENFWLQLLEPADATNVDIPTNKVWATILIFDDDDPPTLGIADASGDEGNPVSFTVSLSAASGKEVSFRYKTSVESGDDATSGTDFTAESGQDVTIERGNASVTLDIATIEDTDFEADETFTVTLSEHSSVTEMNATLESDPTATGTIVDDEELAQVTGVTATAGNGKLTVEWTAVANAQGYRLQWKSENDTDYSNSATDNREATISSGTTVSYDLTGLTNGVEYTVHIAATHNLAGDGAWSTEASGTPFVPDTSMPTLTLATVSGNMLALTYDKDLDEDSVPAASDFTVTVAGSSVAVNDVSVSGKAVTLTLATAAEHGNTVSLSYTIPANNPIQDTSGNDAAALSAQTVTNNTPDTTAPALSSADVHGASLVLTYDEDLDGNSTPGASDFTVTVAGSSVTVSNVSVSGKTVTLTLAAAVEHGNTVSLSYTIPATNPIQDAAGNDAAALSGQAVTNDTPDTTAPVLDTATVNGTSLVLTYDEDLDEDSVPAASDFTVTVAGSSVAVSGVEISGKAVTLTLAARAPYGDTVSLSYTVPASNPIQDVDGNNVMGLSGQTVTNITTTTAVALSVDPASVDEDAGATTVTVTGTLDGAPRTVDTEVTVAVGASGDAATSGTDYAAVADLTLTIATGATSGTATFSLTPTDDDVDEADETLSVTGATTGLTVTGTTVTITDDEARGVTVSATTLSVPEGSTATYTVVLTSEPTADVTVTPSVASGSTDVTFSPESLTFTSDNWGTAQEVTVSAAHDSDIDDDEETIEHAVSGGDYGANSVTASDVAVTVTDDDTAPAIIAGGVEVASYSLATYNTYGVDEIIAVSVTFDRDVNVTTAGGTPYVKVEFKNEDVNAVATEKHFSYASGSGTPTLLFEYEVQAADRDDDGIRIESNALVLNGGVIQDTDSRDALLTHAAAGRQQAHRVDGSEVVGPAELTGFNLRLAGLNSSVSFSPSFDPEITAYTASVDYGVTHITVRATAEEGGDVTYAAEVVEGFQSGRLVVALSAGSNEIRITAKRRGIPNRVYTLTVTRGRPTVTIAASESSTTYRLEDVSFTVTHDQVAFSDEMDVDVAFEQDQTFLPASDLSRTVTIPADESSVTLTLGIGAFTGGATANGTFTAAIAQSDGYAIGTAGSASVDFVVADPALTVRFDNVAYEFFEDDGDVTLDIVAETAPDVVLSDAFSVTVQTRGRDDSAVIITDYIFTGGGVTFEAADFAASDGALAATKSIELQLVDDSVTEGEKSFWIELSANNFPPAATLLQGDGTACSGTCRSKVTIVDDESPGQVTGVELDPGAGALTVDWTAVVSATGYKVQWKSGTETFADAATDNREVTVTPGSTTSYTITGLTDGTDYTVRVIATRTDSPDGPASAEVTGTPGLPTLTIADATATEGNAVEFTVTLSPAADMAVSVEYATSDGTATSDATHEDGADYTAAPDDEALVILAGETSATISIETGDDTVDEDDETFTVTLSSPTSNAVLGTVVAATGTIEDNDTDPAEVTGVAFENAPANGEYALGDEIEVSVTFDTAVEVTGEPRVRLEMPGTEAASYADYDADESTDTVLAFFYTVTADDDDADGISVVANSLELNNGTIFNKETTVVAALAHDAVQGGNIRTRSVESIAITSDPEVRSPAPEGIYGPGEVVEFTVTFAAAVTVDNNDGNPKLVFAASDGARQEAAYVSGTGTTELVFEWTVLADVPGEEGAIDIPANTTGGGTLLTDGGLVLNGGTIEDAQDRGVNIRHGEYATESEVDTTPPVLASGAEGATVDGTTLVLTFERASGVADHLDGSSVPAPEKFIIIAAGSAQQASAVEVDGATVTLTLGSEVGHAQDVKMQYQGSDENPIRDLWGNDTPPFRDRAVRNDSPEPELSITDVTVAEDAGEATFTVTLNVESGEEVTVEYATSDDTAKADSDYEEATGTLTIAAGETSGTFDVTVNNDVVSESDEAFTVTLSGAVGATIATATATGTITDDEEVPTLTISDATATEGSAVEFTVTLSPAADQAVTVAYATTDGTATSDAAHEDGADYTAAASDAELTIDAGETSATISIATGNDAVDEDDETFTVTLSDPSSNAVLGTDQAATGTIVDNDTDPAEVTGVAFENAPSSGEYVLGDVIEVSVTFDTDVEVTGAPRVRLSMSGTAASTSYAHYDGNESTDTVLAFRHTVTADDDDANAISVAANGLELNGGTINNKGTSVAAVLDHDAVQGGDIRTRWVESIAITSEPEVGELVPEGIYGPGEEVSFTVTFSAAVTVDDSGGDPVLIVAASDGTRQEAAYASGSGTTALVFEWTVPSDVSGEEGAIEIPANTTGGGTLLTNGGLVLNGATIEDASSRAVNIRHGAYSTGSEVDTTPPVVASGAGGATVDGTKLMLAFERASGVADHLDESSVPAATDFVVTVAGSAQTVSGVAVDDATVTLTLQSPVGHAQTVTVNYSPGTDPIRDMWGNNAVAFSDRAVRNDSPEPELSIGDVTVAEDAGEATFTVTLDVVSGEEVTVDYATSDDTAETDSDYDEASGTLTIAAGATSNTFDVTVNDDSVGEGDETFTVTLASAVNATIATATATATITDDETPTLTIADASATEGNAMVFTVTLSPAADEAVTVAYATSDGTATADATHEDGADYTAPASDAQLTIAAGQTSGTISIATGNDAVFEGDETFTVTLSDPSSNAVLGTDKAATGTIENNDAASTDAALKSLVLKVGGSDVDLTPVFTATTYSYEADAANIAATVEVVAESNHAKATIAISGDDDTTSPGEAALPLAFGENTLTVTVTAEDGNATQTYTVKVTRGLPVLSWKHGLLVLIENVGEVTLTATLTPASIDEVTVDYATQAAGATPGEDFIETSGTLTFAAGETEKTVKVTILDDNLYEPGGASDVNVILTDPTGTAVLGSGLGNKSILRLTDNDDPPTVTMENVTVDEDAGTMEFTLSLSHGVETDDLEYEVASSGVGGTATSGSDYESFISGSSATLAVPSRATSATFSVSILDDDIDEDDETITLQWRQLSLTQYVAEASQSIDVTGTITDDDTRGVTVSATTLTVPEGGTSTYTVVLTSEPTDDVTVTPSLATGSSSDVTFSPTSLTFGTTDWDTAQTVTVAAGHDDDAVADAATIEHAATGGDYASAPTGEVSVSVTDDDQASTAGALAVEGTSVDEDAGATTITVTGTLNGGTIATATDVTVSVGASGDAAMEGTDYTTVADFTLTIDAGETSGTATFTLTPTDDDIDEADETLSVTGTVTGLTVTGTTLTIADDDERGVTVTPTALDVTEGSNATYTVVLTSEPTDDVTVTPSRASGSTDVTFSPASLTFTSEDWDTAKTVTVAAAEDADAEDDEATISHAVSGGDYGANSVTASSVAVTVDDDETASTAVALSVSPASVAEDAGATTVTVTGTLNGAPRTSATAVTVAVGASSDAATEGTDYATVTDLTLTIDVGETSGTATFTLTPTDDDIDEADETLSVTGTTTGLSVTSTTATITDDDTRGVTVSATTLSVPEGSTATYTVVLTSEPTATVTVTPSRASGSTDVTFSPSSLSFTTDDWKTAQTVTVAAADDDDADNDTATLAHAVSGGDYGTNSVTASDVEVTVSDDETASTTVALSVNPASVAEDAGATTVTVTGTLDGTARTTDTSVTVEVGASSDAAMEGTDYTTVADFTLTIDAGETTGTATFTLTPTDDDLDEADEILSVTGTHMTIDIDTDPANLEELTVTGTSATITDDDTRGVTVTPTALDVTEGSNATYTVVLTSEPTATVTVTPSRASGSSDVTFSPASLSFTADDWNTAKTVTVEAADDDDADNDTATLSHAVSGGDYGTNSVTASSVEVKVDDDETASTAVALSVSPASVAEDAGATTVTVTGTLNGAPRTSATAVTVAVGAPGDAATEGTDYTTVTDLTLTIDAGETSSTATFSLTPTDDDIDEADETLSVKGTTTVTSLSVTATTATIADDDERGVTVTPTALDVTEGSNATYTVVLTSEPTATVTVTPSRASGSSDVTFTPASVTFTSEDWDAAKTVTVAAADDDDAEDDTATLSHAVSGGDYGSETADDVAVTVTDDETASTKVTLSASATSVDEDAGSTSVTVTAELDEAARTSATEVTVVVGASGDGATEGTDYATVNDFTLTIAAGQTSGTASFTLTPTDDDVDEEDETLTVDGTVQDLTVTATTLTIEDDDTRGIAVSPTNLTVAEGRSKSYTVVLSSQPTGAVTVTPSVSGDSDVTVAPSKLTFTEDNWDQPQTVTVSAAQDADAEDASATIVHAVSGGDYGSETAADVSVTVTDDETASTKVTLSVSATSVDEDAGSTTVTVTAELDESARTSATEVTVSVGAAGDGATEGTDYATVSDVTLTIAAGQTSGTASFTLTPTDDDVDEQAETLTVDGTVQSLTVTGTSLTIEDDDTRGIEVSSTDVTVAEGAGSSTYTVVLESQPTADVTVTPSVSGDSDVTVAPSTLTFTEDNWDQPQTVTVSAAQDADADDSSATIAHVVSGGDYGSETADDVAVTVTDDDIAVSAATPSTSSTATSVGSIYLCGATVGTTTGVAYDSSVDVCWDTGSSIPTGSDVVIEERSKDYWNSPNSFSSWQEIARGNTFTPCSEGDDSCVQYAHTGLRRAGTFTQELRIRQGSNVLKTSPQLKAAAPNSNGKGLQAQLSTAMDEDTWAFIEKPTGPFVVGLVFSEPDLGATYAEEAVQGLGTDDFRMTNGTVTAIEGWNSGGYKVRVTPTTLGEPVTIKLKAKTVQGVGEGITAAGTNTFTRSNTGSNKVVQETAAAAGKVTVTPGLSVADAEVNEGADATLSFQVTLSRAASGSVTADWATADGTATAGQDYTAARGTLTFATGETSQTVTVTVLDDTHDEGTETLTLTLSNPSGARITDGTATGTIINSDPMPQAWLARFGRTVADQVLTSVNNRARTARTARVPGFEARIAGQRLEGLLASDEEEEPEAARHQKVDGPSRKRDERGTWLREVTARDFVTGSSFALTGETQESGLGSLWGQGTLARFDGRKGDLSLDGEILSSLLGADWTRGRGIAGVLLSHAQGKGDGDGAMESTLTGLYPYGHYAVNDHLSAWSVFGYSRGELALVPTGGTALEAGIGLAMAAAGARGTVLDGDRNGLTLALISDGMAMRTTSEAVEGLVSSEADVTRLRLGLEGSRPLRLEGGTVLTPAIEIGARHDGGDAETGYGADLGAALAWSYPKRGLKAKVQGRGLVAHQDSDFQERGFAGSLAWDPTPASELGPSFTLQETVGAAATGGMRALMQRDSPAGLTTNEVRGGGRVEAEIGYGLPVWRGRFAGIPSFRFGSADGGRTARLGYRLSPISAEGWQLKLDIETMRRKSANANRPTDHFVGMRAGMRW